MAHIEERDENKQSLSERREKLLGRTAEAEKHSYEDQTEEAQKTKTHSRRRYGPRDAYQSTRTFGGTNGHSDRGRLIDQIPNSWRDEKVPDFSFPEEEEERELRFCDLEDEGSCPNTTRDLIRSRRFRRMIAVLLVVLLVCYYGWRWYLQPRLETEWGYKGGFLHHEVNGTYGTARAGDFEGTRIKELDPSLLPGGEADPEGKRRLVFVGDIHGCKEELVALLKEVGFDAGTDNLIATGDVVSKGPDNLGVLDELIRLKAESVRGNHEDRLYEAAKTVLQSSLPPQSEASSSKGYAKDAPLLKQMKSHHILYIRNMPLMLRIPALPQAKSTLAKHDETAITHNITVVHAGLVPHVPLDRQDPYFVMNMRSIDHRTHVPSAVRGGGGRSSTDSRPWFEIWNWYNDRLLHGRSLKGFFTLPVPHDGDLDDAAAWLSRLFRGGGQIRPKPQVVIYGHDSKAGLQIRRWSRGLDSACVAGGKLTALILDARGRTELVSVNCKNYKS